MSHDDLGRRLQEALAAEQPEFEAVLEELLAEHGRLAAFEALDLADPLRADLETRKTALLENITRVLVHWRALGGRVQLAPPAATAATALPAATAPPAATAAYEEEPDTVEYAPRPVEPAPVEEPGLDALAVRWEAPEIVEAPEPPAPPPTPESLLALRARVAGDGPTPPPDDAWVPALAKLLAALGPPRDDEGELDRVVRAVKGSAGWTLLPRDVQRLMVGLVAARLRRLQDERAVESPALNEAFSSLTAYSARERPGFVFGLTRSHQPVRDTWLDDAEACWEQLAPLVPPASVEVPNRERMLAEIERLVPEIARAPDVAKSAVQSQVVRKIRAAIDAGVPSRDPGLVRVAAPVVDALGGPELRALRRAIREEASEEDEEDADKASAVPPDWRWYNRTRGRRVVMVGGSPREQNRQRLEAAFGFGSLEWEGTEHKRNGLALVRDRVLAGTVDLVILLARFVGHDADRVILPACRDRGVDWVHVDHGYGVERIRRAIERFTEPEDADGSVVPLHGGASTRRAT